MPKEIPKWEGLEKVNRILKDRGIEPLDENMVYGVEEGRDNFEVTVDGTIVVKKVLKLTLIIRDDNFNVLEGS